MTVDMMLLFTVRMEQSTGRMDLQPNPYNSPKQSTGDMLMESIVPR